MVFLVSRWSVESHQVIATCGEFEPTLEDVLNVMALPVYEETNATGVTFEEEDEDEDKHGWLLLLAITRPCLPASP